MTTRKPRHHDLPYAPEQMKLLENVMDALDRLFDNESTTVDVYAILFAAASAMAETDMHEILLATANDLLRILRTGVPTSQTIRDQALQATDNLRARVSAVLPFPN